MMPLIPAQLGVSSMLRGRRPVGPPLLDLSGLSGIRESFDV
jgi:hypothetical protein